MFKLDRGFLDQYRKLEPNWGPLGEFVYKRSYSWNGEEEWHQTIQRVVERCYQIQERHCEWFNLPFDLSKARGSAEEMYDRMFWMKFLPPGRGLANMGSKLHDAKGGACLNNCGFISTDGLTVDTFHEPFTWLMDMSFLGVGVGFDTAGAESEIRLKHPQTTMFIHHIEDSREGWVDAFSILLRSFVGRSELPVFDYSEIREEGAQLSTGGSAPGSAPLKKLLDRTMDYLTARVDQRVDSTIIVDLMNFVGACVVSGGRRRSSEIALGSSDDSAFLQLKSGEALADPSLARWASNNSVLSQSGSDYGAIGKQAASSGEPGVFWLHNAQEFGRMGDSNFRDRRARGVNPCGEQTLESYELCNLVETFPSRHDSLTDWVRTLKYAYLYAKTVTLEPTHSPHTNAVMFRNRRIGLSMSGIVQAIDKFGYRRFINGCDAGYEEVQAWDEIYSEWFCIPRSIKTTTVKPSGTVSLLPGVTPGVHFPHSKHYIRRVEVTAGHRLHQSAEQAGYIVASSAYKDRTVVIEFPVEEKHFIKRKDDVSMWEQLALAADLQRYWSDNQVSITVTVKPEEARDVPRALEIYEDKLKSVSFLPINPGEVYAQAPYEEITAEEYEQRRAGIRGGALRIDEPDRNEARFCDSDNCEI